MSIQTADQAENLAHTSLRDTVESELRWAPELKDAEVIVWIEDRRVVLAGVVDWNYQREAAERLVRNLPGVESVRNQIGTAERTPLQNAEQRLKNATFRDPQIDPDQVVVTIAGQTAVLTGQVRSLAEKRQAGLAAWISPGVIAVDNRLNVCPMMTSRRSPR